MNGNVFVLISTCRCRVRTLQVFICMIAVLRQAGMSLLGSGAAMKVSSSNAMASNSQKGQM